MDPEVLYEIVKQRNGPVSGLAVFVHNCNRNRTDRREQSAKQSVFAEPDRSIVGKTDDRVIEAYPKG